MTTVSETRSFQGRQALTHAGVVIAVGVVATTLAQTSVLGRIPIQNLLKNELNADRSANAAFFFWATLAWYFKPLAGIFTDAFPLFSSRRRSYILISTTLAVLCWFGLGFVPHRYNSLLGIAIVINFFMVIASTVVGGYMVEVAQAISGSGRLTALRNTFQNVSTLISGPLAGFLASIAFGWTATTCGAVMFLLIPTTLLFLHEKRVSVSSQELFRNASGQLRNIAAAKTMWAASGLMALFYIAPGLNTALFYKQQNELHLNTEAQGYLVLVASICGIGASIAYGFACRKLKIGRAHV